MPADASIGVLLFLWASLFASNTVQKLSSALVVVGAHVGAAFANPILRELGHRQHTADHACQWPGATAQEVEQLITRPIEQAIAQNKTIHPAGPDNYGIRSISLPGSSFVYVQLSEDTKDSRQQFSDINLKLQALARGCLRARPACNSRATLAIQRP